MDLQVSAVKTAIADRPVQIRTGGLTHTAPTLDAWRQSVREGKDAEAAGKNPAFRQTILSQSVFDTLRIAAVTDLFMMSHGWRGDIPAAVSQYDQWTASLMGQHNDIMQRQAQTTLTRLNWRRL